MDTLGACAGFSKGVGITDTLTNSEGNTRRQGRKKIGVPEEVPPLALPRKGLPALA